VQNNHFVETENDLQNNKVQKRTGKNFCLLKKMNELQPALFIIIHCFPNSGKIQRNGVRKHYLSKSFPSALFWWNDKRGTIPSRIPEYIDEDAPPHEVVEQQQEDNSLSSIYEVKADGLARDEHTLDSSNFSDESADEASTSRYPSRFVVYACCFFFFPLRHFTPLSNTEPWKPRVNCHCRRFSTCVLATTERKFHYQ
jgi:hypothetical protein